MLCMTQGPRCCQQWAQLSQPRLLLRHQLPPLQALQCTRPFSVPHFCDQWTKVAKQFFAEVWAKFAFAVNTVPAFLKFSTLGNLKLRIFYVRPKWPTDISISPSWISKSNRLDQSGQILPKLQQRTAWPLWSTDVLNLAGLILLSSARVRSAGSIRGREAIEEIQYMHLLTN